MKIELAEATRKDEAVLERLLQLYQYDSSEMLGGDTEEDGRFHFISVDSLWDDPKAHVFITKVDERLCGIAIVIERSHFMDDQDATYMDQFFVMRKYRRGGVGTEIATRLFDRFPGQWEVAEVVPNVEALEFWRRVIGTYTGGNYEERFEESDLWHGPVQTFDTRERVGA